MKTRIQSRYVTPTEMRDVAQHLKRAGTWFTAGMHTINVPSSKTRYVDKSVVKPWTDLEGCRVNMLPGEAARTELLREFGPIKRVGWRGPMIKLFDKKPPMHWSGPFEGEAVLIDLKSAYWQVYRRLFLDQLYPRGLGGRYPLLDVAARLHSWKAARNAVIGICRSRELTGYKDGRRVTLQYKNRFLSPGLWATVQDILHSIAKMALVCGAIYVNTDGYIFQKQGNWDMLDAFMEFLTDQDIVFEMRARGATHIQAWNCYRVGTKTTASYRLGLTQNSKEFSNVSIADAEAARWFRFWRKTEQYV